jgi:hypothetical protein
VLVGALSLAKGAMLSIIAARFPKYVVGVSPVSIRQPAVNLKDAMEAGTAGEMPAAR